MSLSKDANQAALKMSENRQENGGSCCHSVNVNSDLMKSIFNIQMLCGLNNKNKKKIK